MISGARFFKWPIERAPFWLAYKVPPIRMAALGISRIIEGILPYGWYTSGISIMAYGHYKAVQKGRSRSAIEVAAVIGEDKITYTALFEHRFTSPRDIARMLRIVVRSTREFSRRYGDPQIYFTKLLPVVVSMAADFEQLKEYMQGLDKIIKGYHEKHKDTNTGKCPTLTIYVQALVLMVPGAKGVVTKLIQSGKIEPGAAIKAYFDALDVKAHEVLDPPSYYQQKGESSQYLSNFIAPLLKVAGSGKDLVVWAEEFKRRINAFSNKYQPEAPTAYAKFLVFLAVKIKHLGQFKKAAGKIDNMLDDYHQKFGQHVRMYSFYLEVVFQALRKTDSLVDDSFSEFEKWDKAVKFAMYVCMDALIKQRQRRIAAMEGQGVPHERAAESTLKTLVSNFHQFLSRVVLEMIKKVNATEQFRSGILKLFPDFKPPANHDK